MINSFNTNIACTYSVNTAIFVQQLAQWTFVNLANNRNIHDGHCWSYNSQEALSIIFPYWSRQNLRTIINHCIEQGLVIQGNYNKKKYDKTTWYALTEKGLSFFPELQNIEQKLSEKSNETSETHASTDWLESTNPLVEINQAIPTNNSTNKKVIYKYITKKPAFDLFWSVYPMKKAKQMCWQYWDRHKLEKHSEEIMQALQKQIASDDHFLKGYIRNPLKYLREEGWLDPINEAKDKQSNGKDKINYLLLGL
jgi:hypothetical protein